MNATLPRRLLPDLRRRAAVAMVALCFLPACSKGAGGGGGAAGRHAIGGLGKPVAQGSATDLRVTADGKFATYLADAQKPRLDGIPPQMVTGVLHVVPLGGGSARRVGTGVTNVPGGLLLSADSRWVLFLAGYNPAAQAGELHALDLSDASAEPKKLGSAVTYMLTSPDSRSVLFVEGGVLKVGALGEGPFREVAGEVSVAQFSPDSERLFFKRKLSAAGGLFMVPLKGAAAPVKLADQVGDFLVAPDSARVAFSQRSEVVRSTYDLLLAAAPEWKVQKLAGGVGTFAFSPDGKWLARTEGQKPELLGDLHVGPASGGPGRKLGTKVQELAFAPDSTAIAYLELYDISARAGLLGMATLPDGKPTRVGDRCPNFTWGADGKSLAFLSRFIKPIYSVDLMLYQVGQEAAFKVQPGVFGYGFGPKNEYLLFRTNCIRNGRACDLHRLDLAKPKEPSQKLLEGVYSWKSSSDGGRVLVSYARVDGDTFDVSVFNLRTGQRKTLDQQALLPAVFLDDAGSKVAYALSARASPGVYVAAEVP